MFDSLDSTIEIVYKTLWSFILLYILMPGGIGFLFKILSVPLKIFFSNRKLTKLDNDFFNLQLLRIFHGINVETIRDAELVQKAIAENKLTKKDFKFLTFGPIIGKQKKSTFEIYLVVLISLAAIFFLYALGSTLNESKYGYAFYSQDNKRVLVSTINVYNPAKKEYITKRECKQLPANTPGIIQSSCAYIVTDDIGSKEELKNAIESNNNGIIVIGSIFTLIFILISLGLITYVNYFRTNNIFYKFKMENENL